MPKKKRPNRIKSYIGHRFGKLIALRRIDIESEYNKTITKYECLCDCGKITIVTYNNLKTGNTQSCGCLRKAGNQPRVDKIKQRVNAIGRYYRRNALTRNISWSLSNAQVEALVTESCYFCGYFDSILLNGIDRLDNDLGYYQENVVSCCRWCNIAKSKRNVKDFLEWVQKAYKHNVKYFLQQ